MLIIVPSIELCGPDLQYADRAAFCIQTYAYGESLTFTHSIQNPDNMIEKVSEVRHLPVEDSRRYRLQCPRLGLIWLGSTEIEEPKGYRGGQREWMLQNPFSLLCGMQLRIQMPRGAHIICILSVTYATAPSAIGANAGDCARATLAPPCGREMLSYVVPSTCIICGGFGRGVEVRYARLSLLARATPTYCGYCSYVRSITS